MLETIKRRLEITGIEDGTGYLAMTAGPILWIAGGIWAIREGQPAPGWTLIGLSVLVLAIMIGVTRNRLQRTRISTGELKS